MNFTGRYKFTVALIFLTPILVFGAMLMTGGGHQTWPFFVIFPWAMIGTVLEESVSFLFVALGILQFPVYGLLIDRSRETKLSVVFSIIVLQHIVLIAALLLTRSDNWIP